MNCGATLPDVVVGRRTSDFVVRRVFRPMRSGVRVISSGNPLTGTKCIVDVKVDTGSPYTIL